MNEKSEAQQIIIVPDVCALSTEDYIPCYPFEGCDPEEVGYPPFHEFCYCYCVIDRKVLKEKKND